MKIKLKSKEILKGWIRKAPEQNRTVTNSLEGYGSTIELQALKFIERIKLRG